jgi:hypothetical protein
MVLNAYVKRQITWMKDGTTLVDLTPYVYGEITTDLNKEPRNNMCSIRLLDNNDVYNPITREILFQEGDLIIVYAKIIIDNSDTVLSSNDVIWTGKFVDHTRIDSPDERSITIKVTDFAYDIFNRYWAKRYDGMNMRTNEIVQDICENLSETYGGLGTYTLDFTNIQTTRPNGSLFPVIEPNFIMKPVYEWTSELSSTNWTNSEAEITANAQICRKQMVFAIKGTSVYWYYPTGTTILTIDNYTYVSQMKLDTNNEKASNFLIVDCGEDLDGEAIITYWYNETSNSPVQKDDYQTQYKIAGTNSDYDRAYHPLKAQAISEGWSNNTFRNRVRVLAKSYSDNYFKFMTKGRPIISVTLPKIEAFIGDRVYVSKDKYTAGLYEITSVSHIIGDNEWSTQLKLEKEVEI